MPHPLVPTASNASRMVAVADAFKARLRNGMLDTPRAVRLARPLIAQEIQPAAPPAVAAGQRPRGPSLAEASSPVRPLGRKPPRSPTWALAVRNQEEL